MSRHPSTTELHAADERAPFVHVLIVAFGAPERELGRRFPVIDELVIGRSSPMFEHAAKTMSRRHAEVKRQADALVVTDLESRKGTFVNGERIQKREVVVGDVIVVGDLGLVVAWAPSLFVPEVEPSGRIAFASFIMARTLAELRATARTTQPVALVGEPGVGKRLFAEVLHAESGAGGELVVIDAAALDATTWATKRGPRGQDTVLFARMSEASEAVVRICVDLLRRRERKEDAPRVVIALGTGGKDGAVSAASFTPRGRATTWQRPRRSARPIRTDFSDRTIVIDLTNDLLSEPRQTSRSRRETSRSLVTSHQVASPQQSSADAICAELRASPCRRARRVRAEKVAASAKLSSALRA